MSGKDFIILDQALGGSRHFTSWSLCVKTKGNYLTFLAKISSIGLSFLTPTHELASRIVSQFQILSAVGNDT